MNNVLFTIVVPAYNYGHYLPETLSSIKHQTYTHWECIIINDGSTDNTESIAQGYVLSDNRFRLINRQNSGLVKTRNIGILEATGEYIIILDSDDILRENHLSLIAQTCSFVNSDVVYCNTLLWWQHDSFCTFDKIPFRLPEHECSLDSKTMYRRLVFDSTQMTMHSAAFKKSKAIECGLFIPNRGTGYEDNEFWIRMCRSNATFYYINKPIALYRQHSNSIVHSQKMFFEGKLTEVRILKEQYDSRFITQKELSIRIAEIYRGILRDFIRAKQYDHAKKVLALYWDEFGKKSKGAFIRSLLFKIRIMFKL